MRISDWSSDVCSSDLLVLSELHRTPELGRIFYDHSRGEAARQLADFCRQATEAQRLNCPDPALAGEQLAALIFGEPVTSTVMGVASQPTRERLRHHAHEAVALFLSHYGTGAHCSLFGPDNRLERSSCVPPSFRPAKKFHLPREFP